jgi:hypothetical protein
MRVGGNIPLLRAERWRFAARAAATASAHSEETRRRAEHTVRLLYAGTEVSAEERGITNATRFFAAARIVADGALQRTVAQALQEALAVGHRGRIAREAAISRGAEPQRTACAVDQDTSATAAVLAGVARAIGVHAAAEAGAAGAARAAAVDGGLVAVAGMAQALGVSLDGVTLPDMRAMRRNA